MKKILFPFLASMLVFAASVTAQERTSGVLRITTTKAEYLGNVAATKLTSSN